MELKPPSRPSLPGAPSPPAQAGYWRDCWRRFRRQRLPFAAFLSVAALALLAVFAPLVVGTKPIVCSYKGAIYFPFLEYYWTGGENSVFYEDRFRGVFPRNLSEKDPGSWAVWPLIYQDPYRPLGAREWDQEPGATPREPPSSRHWLGTDSLGRDVLARVVFGTRIALLVGIVSMGIAGLLGIVLGSLAGYFGGLVDLVISRFIELMMSIPTLVFILVIFSVVENPGIYHVMAVIGLTRWESIARYTRGEFIRLRDCDFVVAARAVGARWHRIVWRHILPNALAPALVTLSFGVANAILLESALSFLKAGGISSPSWGSILWDWYDGSHSAWWIAVFPGLAVFASVLAYNLIGDGLQEALDPRLAAPRR